MCFQSTTKKKKKKKWLKCCPLEYSPFYYLRYIDDIFLLRNSTKISKRFLQLLSRHVNIFFIIENEKDNRMSFLEVYIIRKQDKFTSTVCRKPTLSRIYTRFDSFSPSTYKINMIHILLYRCLQIYSGWTKLHLELVKLMDVFKSAYPANIIINCFNTFLDNKHRK